MLKDMDKVTWTDGTGIQHNGIYAGTKSDAISYVIRTSSDGATMITVPTSQLTKVQET